MSLAEARRAAPTGLLPQDIADLSAAEKRVLDDWHGGKGGKDGARLWLPRVVRSLSLADRMRLAWDPQLDAAWEERERRRVARSAVYFTVAYGHVQPQFGPPVPFDLWDRQQRAQMHAIGVRDQADVLRLLADPTELALVLLKARQLGMTWAALHVGFHVIAFDPRTPNGRVLGLSKHGGDATALVERARKIRELLPPFLRPDEDPETSRSLSKLRLIGRGELISLAGSPEAARQYTAELAILDEFAFIRNGNAAATWTAVIPAARRKIVISTGNGPEEAPGDGQAFARLYRQARAGATDESAQDLGVELRLRAVFLPSSTDPERDDRWRRSKRGEFLSDEDFLAEYPETEDEALAGKGGTKVYSPAGISAAEALGREFDGRLERDEMPEPAGGTLKVDFDFGEYTHGLAVWPLEGGGLYVFDEVVGGGTVGMTVADAARSIMGSVAAVQLPDERTGRPTPLAASFEFDSAGVESARTFLATVENGSWHEPCTRCRTTGKADGGGRCPACDGRGHGVTEKVQAHWDQAGFELDDARWDEPIVECWEWVPYGGRRAVRWVSVRFNAYKDESKDYLRVLFNRAAAGERTRIVAISPRCKTLLRQLRGLELMDDGSGRIEKGDDHGPDALISAAAPIAAGNRDGGLPRELAGATAGKGR